MVFLYLDTSALAKRYVNETGSAWVRSLLEPAAGNETWTARITGPEIASAMFLRMRIGSLTHIDAVRAVLQYRGHEGSDYQVVELTAPIASRAMTVVERHGLRGFDAVHIASALAVGRSLYRDHAVRVAFISADARQLQAAQAEGLSVDNPNVHP